MTTTPAPAPTASDEAAFVADLRRLKTWSGRSFRQLERRATAAGDTLPYSTAATMLGKNRLPREELVAAFVRACGLDEDAVSAWLTTRASIAGGTVTAPPRLRPTFRWRRAMVVAAVAIAFAGGAAFTAVIGNDSVEEQETVVVAP